MCVMRINSRKRGRVDVTLIECNELIACMLLNVLSIPFQSQNKLNGRSRNTKLKHCAVGDFQLQNVTFMALQNILVHDSIANMGSCTSNVIDSNLQASFVYKLPVELLCQEIFPLLSSRSIRTLDTATRCLDQQLEAFGIWMAQRPLTLTPSNVRRATEWYVSRGIYPIRISSHARLITANLLLLLRMAKEARTIIIKGSVTVAPWRYISLKRSMNNVCVLQIAKIELNPVQLVVLLKGLTLLEELRLKDIPWKLPHLPNLDTLYVTYATSPTAKFARRLIEACPLLTSLHFAHLDCPAGSTEETAMALHWSHLTHLSLVQSLSCSPEVICALALHCRDLTKLDLTYSTAACSTTVVDLARQLPLLQELRLDYSYHITDTRLVSITSVCPNMRVLSVNGCLEVSNESMCKLPQHCPLLRELYCVDVPRFTWQKRLEVCAALPALRVVKAMVWELWWM